MTWEELKKNKKALLAIGGVAIIGIAGTAIGVHIRKNQLDVSDLVPDVKSMKADLPKLDLSNIDAINTDHWIENDGGMDKFIIEGVRLSDLGALGKELAEAMEVDEAITSLVVETMEVV